jgi:hypothetical protein
MSKTNRYVCGVPAAHCTGGKVTTDQQINSGKAHTTPSDAFNCMARYLVQVLGYKRVGGREFDPQDGGPIRVLTKKSRYGGKMKLGKEGRYMPDERRHGGNRGLIAG